MEVVINNSRFGSIVSLVSQYGGLVASNLVKLSKGKNVAMGEITEPKAILSTLASKSEFAKVLTGASADRAAIVDEYVDLVAAHKFEIADAKAVADLNSKLQASTFAAAPHITLADLVLYPSLHGWVSKATTEERVKACNVTRYFNHIQHLPGVIGTELPVVFIEQDLPAPAPKEKKGAEKAAEAPKAAPAEAPKAAPKAAEAAPKAEGEKKEKKEKAPKAPKAPAAPAAPARELDDVTRLDIRVGRIVKAWPHPEADKLWCEEIEVGEDQPRQIASGLRDFMSHEQMEGARVLVVCNLRPRTMRGFTSNGMVMCASNDAHDKVEFVVPPADAKVGERITWPGYEGAPEELLPKKEDVFGAVAPGFVTDDNCVATFKGAPFTTSAGVCKAATLTKCKIA